MNGITISLNSNNKVNIFHMYIIISNNPHYKVVNIFSLSFDS